MASKFSLDRRFFLFLTLTMVMITGNTPAHGQQPAPNTFIKGVFRDPYTHHISARYAGFLGGGQDNNWFQDSSYYFDQIARMGANAIVGYATDSVFHYLNELDLNQIHCISENVNFPLDDQYRNWQEHDTNQQVWLLLNGNHMKYQIGGQEEDESYYDFGEWPDSVHTGVNGVDPGEPDNNCRYAEYEEHDPGYILAGNIGVYRNLAARDYRIMLRARYEEGNDLIEEVAHITVYKEGQAIMQDIFTIYDFDDEGIYETLEFDLLSAYPNPFNSTTIINYQLPNRNEVQLHIYDVSGREVATLINGMVEAGYHQAVWNAKDISAGIYFCLMEAGAFERARKLVLVK